MTASQKDGTVRIWSWDVDPSIPDTYLQNNDRGLRNIVIKLTNPTSMSSDSRKSRRRAPSASSTASSESKTSCDVAAWAHDDTKIITSQSQQLRQTSSEIQPGSHFLFLWDSLAGHCLLGISGGHTMACPVVIPHPTDTSIFCSAGADGYVKVWDWESGKCLFSHKNTLEHGHIENPNDREKISGFLDGTFTPDGTGIVLTDDSGRVSIFDSIVPKSQQLASPENSVLPKPPFWMMEQYFSNDYYDLFYETNGYCVERGSQLPPHLAPHGVRCTHSGAPLPDNITDAFRKLTGPHPNPVQNCRWRRESIRCRAQRLQGSGRKVHSASSHQRGNIMQEFNALTTILISSTGETIKTRNAQGEIVSAPIPSASPAARRGAAGSASPVGTSPAVRTSSSGRQLSANYRWRDYEDMLQEERFLNDDDDDDEFQLPARRTSSRLNDSDDSDEDLENFSRRHGQSNRSGSQNHRQSTRRNATESSPEVRRSRSSNRRSTSGRNRRQYDEPDSDDEDVEEFVSTNNEPTGPFVADYNTHFFRLPANGPEISREWLTRIESDSGFSGRKIYAPQCGDSVIYIPRAHYETIEAFPTLEAPWMHWPNEAEWPIVNCRIRDIRYRFPFISYYGNRNVNRNACNSVVAILTLEVIGIPVLSQERVFHWPSPSFITPTRNHVFEVSMFESGQEEFLFPYDRFVYRIQCLEEAITLNGGAADGIELSTYYGDEENNVNDNDLVAYRGKLADYEQYDRELNDPNLNNSGFSALQVTWDDISQANDANDMSPWEVVVERPKSKKYSLSRTCLSDDESKQVREALKKLKRRPVVRELFLKEVDRRYSDYPLRVEVPMHLSLIQRRLDNNYYTSRWSVVADVRLIRDNCIKYNGEVGELSDAAREMYQEFEEAILSEEERNAYHNIGTTLQQPNARESSETRSSLENLPPPEDNSSRRRSLRIRIDTSQNRDQAEGRASGRPTRSNSALSNQQAAHSASFANASARGRQGRRQSNDSGTSDISGRQRRVPPRQSSRRGFTGNEGSANSLANASAPRPSRRSSRRDAYLDPEEDAEESNEAVSGRRTRSHGPAEELGIGESDYEAPARAKRDAESDSDTEHKIDQPGTQRQSRSRRPPQRFSEDDSAGESEQDTGPPTRKRKSRKDESEAEENEGSNSEDEFMEADKDQESEPEDEEGERKRNKKGSRNRNASLEAVNGRRASSRRSSQKVSYEEQSSSEFEEPMSEEDDYLAESTKTRRRSSPMRSPRKRKTPARTSRKRKAKSDYDEDSDEDEEEDEVVSPRLSKRRRSGSGRSPRKAKSEPWQEINVRRIPRVGKQILAFLVS